MKSKFKVSIHIVQGAFKKEQGIFNIAFQNIPVFFRKRKLFLRVHNNRIISDKTTQVNIIKHLIFLLSHGTNQCCAIMCFNL